ncbi:Fur family transcriptional regulator [Alicyclobacillus tolerans]|uniref:Fur family zinc uptake transcriptional regulator n=1 Tax=Alicyclobacillus tolerans TaxID=90970 RepID=A0ABT9LYB9_9BACL|nr:Fur family transcriptional regulator [Alicyclobacillus tengchongensis]MDP9729259.1 Fur family zinc uptake transcriptional regulator [Alicyclobacillus tengchongensis]
MKKSPFPQFKVELEAFSNFKLVAVSGYRQYFVLECKLEAYGRVVQMNRSQEVLQQLKDAGYKFTGKRQMVIDYFVNHEDKFLTAKDVYENVRETYPNVSYDTIYRTLTLLRELGVLEEMEFSEDAMRYRLTCDKHHHHHLVCLECGSITPLEDCPMSWLPELPNGFRIVNHRFEVYGICAACQAKKSE